jgi:hypothetical protein
MRAGKPVALASAGLVGLQRGAFIHARTHVHTHTLSLSLAANTLQEL